MKKYSHIKRTLRENIDILKKWLVNSFLKTFFWKILDKANNYTALKETLCEKTVTTY